MTSTADLAISPQALTRLRADASRRDPAALEAVAKEFEALFLREILRNVRDGSLAEDVLGSDHVEFYQDLHDAQLAASVARSGGFGLARVIEQQLAGMVDRTAPDADSREPAAAGVTLRHAPLPPVPLIAPLPIARAPVAPVVHVAETGAGRAAAPARPEAVGHETFAPATQEDFVRQLLPHARRAAEQLGIAPSAIIAQAALETGWGQRMPRLADGSPSFNLFGIKAGASWTGARAHVSTLEYVDGMAVRSRAHFRAYDSLGDAMQDYVQLVGGSERYRPAVQAGADARAYATALARAGYATDPAYAAKLHAILDRPLIQGLVP